MPKSPLEIFFDNVRRDMEHSAQELLRDFNREARQNLRDMARQARVSQNQAQNTSPVAGKRATRGQRVQDPPILPVSSPVALRTLYDILEVSPFASAETISAAFRSLSSRFHPDNQKTGNAERYKEITEAWAVMKHPGKRKEYDRKLGLK